MATNRGVRDPSGAQAPESVPDTAESLSANDLRAFSRFVVRVTRPGRVVPNYISCGTRRAAERLVRRLNASGMRATISAAAPEGTR